MNKTIAILSVLALAACSGPKLTAPECPSSGEVEPANAEGAPPVVWDDAASTYLRFPGHQEMPAVFALREDGTERAVNTNVDPTTRTITVHGVYQTIVLRDGKRVACIRNNAFDRVGRSAQ